MVGRPDASLLVAKVESALDAVAPYLGDTDHAALAALSDRLTTPLRVALVGRVNSGKSTLLNALVGQRVAPTNETECTQVATWFRFGAPARVEVFGLDKKVSILPVRHRLPDELGRPASEIDYVIAHIPSALLREYELIDTPGLGTMNSTHSAATRRALIDTSAGRGIERPDGTLFLSDGAPRADEVAFLNEMGATRIDTLALLSHADTFGEGAFGSVDPLEMAAKHAEHLKPQLARLAGTVLPVSGLLAETALTGHLTEADARALAHLEPLEEFELAGILSGQDETDLDREDVDRLLELIGDYGILYARTLASQGAIALAQWLADKSGLTAVHEQITRRFLRRSEVLKARHILTQLEKLAVPSPHRAEVCAILEAVKMHPGLHPLRELSALELMLQWDPTHPLVQELDHLGVAATPAEALRLPLDADSATINNAAQQACVHCKRERLTAFSAAEREAWTVLERSYQLIFTPK
ncbi:MAG TPA: dynamin family protein [Mycobacterium sp.]|uniref:dynamin family protein n=1 Tax=Mycobacterium sp. TaxID=1785 RepID=UPI002C5C6B62|nr:dynamin family protein [Mycobacterium sp.]HME77198.1 dynamin family protein [Mycobacterium sp.]